MEEQPNSEPEEEIVKVRLEEVHPHFKKYKNEIIGIHNIRRYDTLIQKSKIDSVFTAKDSVNKSKIEQGKKRFNERQ